MELLAKISSFYMGFTVLSRKFTDGESKVKQRWAKPEPPALPYLKQNVSHNKTVPKGPIQLLHYLLLPDIKLRPECFF